MFLKLKKIIIPALGSRFVSAAATKILGCGVPIFMLHRMSSEHFPNLGGTKPDHLRRCLAYLQEQDYTYITLEQLALALKNGRPLPPKAVAFTMDDGYLDQAEVAAPIFHEYNCPLTFFVITGMLDRAVWPWDAQVSWLTETSKKPALVINIAGKCLELKLNSINSRRNAKRTIQNLIREISAEHVPGILHQLTQDADVVIPEQIPAPYTPMTWESARNLETTGVQFAPHSVSHHILSRLTADALEMEILESWNTMQKELAKPVKIFCYPTGRAMDFGQREINALKRQGYLGAVSTSPEYVETQSKQDNQLFRLPRFALPDSIEDFIQYCSWIEYAKHKFRNAKPMERDLVAYKDIEQIKNTG